MSDNLDFTRLVSLSNPAAAGRYQQASNEYPPSTSNNNQLLDPFFDDDDEVPDSAFGGPPLGQRNKLPLGQTEIPPVISFSKTSLSSEAVSQDWVFDDDDIQSSNPEYSAASMAKHGRTRPGRMTWRWPWQQVKVAKGDRIVTLNDRTANVDFCSNFVSTSKYNTLTFIPKFFAGTYSSFFLDHNFQFISEQFSKYANIFFLFTACIQQIPDVSPTNPYTTIVPLALVLLASAFKEISEDLVSYSSFLSPCGPVPSPDHTLLRNDISLTRNSTRAGLRFLPTIQGSQKRNGKIFKSAMSSVLKVTTSFRRTCCSSAQASPKAFVTSRPPILTGGFLVAVFYRPCYEEMMRPQRDEPQDQTSLSSDILPHVSCPC
jgi:Phospholipid-translocating ATPase N-terminal